MKRLLYAIVPVFAFFGPLLIVQSIPDLTPAGLLWASVGALMTGGATVGVLLRQREIEARLDAAGGAESEGPGG